MSFTSIDTMNNDDFGACLKLLGDLAAEELCSTSGDKHDLLVANAFLCTVRVLYKDDALSRGLRDGCFGSSVNAWLLTSIRNKHISSSRLLTAESKLWDLERRGPQGIDLEKPRQGYPASKSLPSPGLESNR